MPADEAPPAADEPPLLVHATPGSQYAAAAAACRLQAPRQRPRLPRRRPGRRRSAPPSARRAARGRRRAQAATTKVGKGAGRWVLHKSWHGTPAHARRMALQSAALQQPANRRCRRGLLSQRCGALQRRQRRRSLPTSAATAASHAGTATATATGERWAQPREQSHLAPAPQRHASMCTLDRPLTACAWAATPTCLLPPPWHTRAEARRAATMPCLAFPPAMGRHH